jgi:hypothetical protein
VLTLKWSRVLPQPVSTGKRATGTRAAAQNAGNRAKLNYERNVVGSDGFDDGTEVTQVTHDGMRLTSSVTGITPRFDTGLAAGGRLNAPSEAAAASPKQSLNLSTTITVAALAAAAVRWLPEWRRREAIRRVNFHDSCSAQPVPPRRRINGHLSVSATGHQRKPRSPSHGPGTGNDR